MSWNGMEWNGMEWKWNGLDWIGLEWICMLSYGMAWYVVSVMYGSATYVSRYVCM